MREGTPLTETILKINEWKDLDKLSDKYLVLQILRRKPPVKEPYSEFMQTSMPPVSSSLQRAEMQPPEGPRYSKYPQASVKVNLMDVQVTSR